MQELYSSLITYKTHKTLAEQHRSIVPQAKSSLTAQD